MSLTEKELSEMNTDCDYWEYRLQRNKFTNKNS